MTEQMGNTGIGLWLRTEDPKLWQELFCDDGKAHAWVERKRWFRKRECGVCGYRRSW